MVFFGRWFREAHFSKFSFLLHLGPVLGVILVSILGHSDWIRRDTPYSVRMWENTEQNNSEYRYFLHKPKVWNFTESGVCHCCFSINCANFSVDVFLITPFSNCFRKGVLLRSLRMYIVSTNSWRFLEV